MLAKIQIFFTVFLLTSTYSAEAAWLESDNKTVEDAGILSGMATYCGLKDSDVVVNISIYIGIHQTDVNKIEKITDLFNDKSGDGYMEMSSINVDKDIKCAMVPGIIKGKVNRYVEANKTKSKIIMPD